MILLFASCAPWLLHGRASDCGEGVSVEAVRSLVATATEGSSCTARSSDKGRSRTFDVLGQSVEGRRYVVDRIEVVGADALFYTWGVGDVSTSLEGPGWSVSSAGEGTLELHAGLDVNCTDCDVAIRGFEGAFDIRAEGASTIRACGALQGGGVLSAELVDLALPGENLHVEIEADTAILRMRYPDGGLDIEADNVIWLPPVDDCDAPTPAPPATGNPPDPPQPGGPPQITVELFSDGEGPGVEFSISGSPSGEGYDLGFIQGFIEDLYVSEDCLYSGFCHAVQGSVRLHFLEEGTAEPGETTAVDLAAQEQLTLVVRDRASPACWTTGPNTAYYIGCQAFGAND